MGKKIGMEGVAGYHTQRDYAEFMGIPELEEPQELGVPLSVLADMIERGEI